MLIGGSDANETSWHYRHHHLRMRRLTGPQATLNTMSTDQDAANQSDELQRLRAEMDQVKEENAKLKASAKRYKKKLTEKRTNENALKDRVVELEKLNDELLEKNAVETRRRRTLQLAYDQMGGRLQYLGDHPGPSRKRRAHPSWTERAVPTKEIKVEAVEESTEEEEPEIESSDLENL
ncbi:hypothetical protein QR680_009793 [Steinernema hermaphroditum]|uniref:Uncharacterized protein n=1 Tax=Steinernema hermaphroditum TaxID=289476 RepID=A0AA39IN19_9BILA|nr:hypothetical protein QR680_009793 [Steinernema hermaphroditum]